MRGIIRLSISSSEHNSNTKESNAKALKYLGHRSWTSAYLSEHSSCGKLLTCRGHETNSSIRVTNVCCDAANESRRSVIFSPAKPNGGIVDGVMAQGEISAGWHIPTGLEGL
jgi:hypothetical protein